MSEMISILLLEHLGKFDKKFNYFISNKSVEEILAYFKIFFIIKPITKLMESIYDFSEYLKLKISFYY